MLLIFEFGASLSIAYPPSTSSPSSTSSLRTLPTPVAFNFFCSVVPSLDLISYRTNTLPSYTIVPSTTFHFTIFAEFLLGRHKITSLAPILTGNCFFAENRTRVSIGPEPIFRIKCPMTSGVLNLSYCPFHW